ncbi:glycosyl hydrolase [Streptomyces alboflavus]|uniref:Glycosyl hydrolase n=1 Tax=Streptomyces alboflavus TaxID=67267 RepID=A0A1Z1WMI2_9ACTN|nr:glycosyl hydrolase [Streptomyces alboflavus]
MGLLWYEPKQFGSYSLKLDWRISGADKDDNSGIFVGFPPSDDPWTAVNNGYEIQIDATDVPRRPPARSTASSPPTSPPATGP